MKTILPIIICTLFFALQQTSLAESSAETKAVVNTIGREFFNVCQSDPITAAACLKVVTVMARDLNSDDVANFLLAVNNAAGSQPTLTDIPPAAAVPSGYPVDTTTPNPIASGLPIEIPTPTPVPSSMILKDNVPW